MIDAKRKFAPTVPGGPGAASIHVVLDTLAAEKLLAVVSCVDDPDMDELRWRLQRAMRVNRSPRTIVDDREDTPIIYIR